MKLFFFAWLGTLAGVFGLTWLVIEHPLAAPLLIIAGFTGAVAFAITEVIECHSAGKKAH